MQYTPERASLAVEVSASKTEVKPDEIHGRPARSPANRSDDQGRFPSPTKLASPLAIPSTSGRCRRAITKSVKLTADRAFAVSAIGHVAGSKVEASGGTVNMRLLKTEPQPDMLKMKAEPSLTQLEEAGTVTFSITVSSLMGR